MDDDTVFFAGTQHGTYGQTCHLNWVGDVNVNRFVVVIRLGIFPESRPWLLGCDVLTWILLEPHAVHTGSKIPAPGQTMSGAVPSRA